MGVKKAPCKGQKSPGWGSKKPRVGVENDSPRRRLFQTRQRESTWRNEAVGGIGASGYAASEMRPGARGRTWRTSLTADSAVSTSKTFRPSLAAASSVTCWGRCHRDVWVRRVYVRRGRAGRAGRRAAMLDRQLPGAHLRYEGSTGRDWRAWTRRNHGSSRQVYHTPFPRRPAASQPQPPRAGSRTPAGRWRVRPRTATHTP